MLELFPRNGQAPTSDRTVASSFEGPTTVLVAVHKPQVREALVAAIEATEGFVVVGEAASEEDAVEQAGRLRPGIALVDEDLPSCCGAWTIRTLAEQGLAGAIVGLGLRGDGRVRARMAGADAYVQMGATSAELVEALRAAAAAAMLAPPASHSAS